MGRALNESPVVDVAGGLVGGAARWRAELDGFIADHDVAVRVIGRGRQLTPRWLVERERAAGRRMAVAANNVSFMGVASPRVVLVRQALHFLYQHEQHLLSRMPATWGRQIRIARMSLRRAHVIVAPCTAMADRVIHHYPAAASRIVVRPHPVTPVGSRKDTDLPFILVPVTPGRYKNVLTEVEFLSTTLTHIGNPTQIWLTANRNELPINVGWDPRVVPLGVLPHGDLVDMWRTAAAVFYPGAVESFGYPLAEARAYGVPVIAPATAQTKEIAGPALRGYRIGDTASLSTAVERITEPLAPDPAPFERDQYFLDLLTGTS